MIVLSVVGARPQFVKAAVVSRVMQMNSEISEILVHTGQHFDNNMSQVFFDEMEIPKPAINLGVGGGTHGQNTGRMLEKLEDTMKKSCPDVVLVYGDTDSTLAGALAAVKLHIPVAHVEAGLRSYNRFMPEETNRVLTDHISKILFAPTSRAVSNLAAEGIHGKNVLQHGDVMYDAILYYRKFSKKPECDLPAESFVMGTLHRAENTDSKSRLMHIVDALKQIADQIPIVLPLHPRTQKMIKLHHVELEHHNIRVIEPVGYFQMIWLLEHCELVMTDSGGLQKEAYFFNKPCITFRDETEWLELVDVGANVLTGADTMKIVCAFRSLLGCSFRAENLYGDGRSANYMVNSLLDGIEQ